MPSAGACDAGRLQPGGGVGGRHRARQGVTLDELAAEVDDARPCDLRLDTLGDDAEAEIVGERDRGANDLGVAHLPLEPLDERPVDLELVDRQAFEVCK